MLQQLIIELTWSLNVRNWSKRTPKIFTVWDASYSVRTVFLTDGQYLVWWSLIPHIVQNGFSCCLICSRKGSLILNSLAWQSVRLFNWLSFLAFPTLWRILLQASNPPRLTHLTPYPHSSIPQEWPSSLWKDGDITTTGCGKLVRMSLWVSLQ